MIKIKLGRQGLISFSILVLIVLWGCKKNEEQIYGIWKVESQELKIKEEFEFMEVVTPGILQDKFKRMFPEYLEEKDQVEFNKKGEVSINSSRKYSFQKSDTLLSITNKDMIYPLTYKLENGRMIVKRETYQGEIRWNLVKK